MKKITFILFSIAFNWELNLYIEDIDDSAGAANDYLVLGTCEQCHDGFHYGEDQYDPPTGVSPYTDIQFFNLSWLGSIDSNNNECDNPEFAVDKKSTHSPSDLLEWGIRGVSMGHDASLQITWEMEEISEEYEIYLYVGEIGYNLKTESNIDIESQELAPIYENINGEWVSFDNIKILMGGCASTGTLNYYIDQDEDGLGSGLPHQFCPGYEPEGYINNDLDLDDSIFCISNNIDDCGVCNGFNNDQDCLGICFGNAQLDDCEVCNGFNNDQDCSGTCFGNAQLDDCEVCNGSNEDCIDQIFAVLPHNLHALIDENQIFFSWDFDINIQQSFLLGFNIYHGIDELNLNLISSTETNYYVTNAFDSGVFCISLYDRFNNESELVCTTATEYIQYNYALHEGANLISFPYIPENNSVENIFDLIKDELEGIIGEGNAAYYDTNLGWIGNLDNIDYHSGYWVKIKPNSNIEDTGFNILGYPYNPVIIYNLHEGYNLISYKGEDNMSLEDAIPEELQNHIISIIGEGRASIYNQELEQWLGNLNELKFGSGYWIEATEPVSFYWYNQ